ncbi:uncharacterized protein KQ657_003221 [Scheffersomyces spartinae]|uniref:Uncharacterized protein n=1 Tax=Scheffersomyces spartinae TaxID=45513 RepID=A0A9P7VCR1_9ASCO|nr:uncharacterized protein KQ657_003221 [Scheffersomyces spartinae]KAG7195459.1 hypothetical protein KQ657_003221 [Scheffersomyces spartinae]
MISELSQAWGLISLNSILCILGTLVLFLDDLYHLLMPLFITRRYPFEIKENYSLLNGTMSFSSGCLLFTSLYKLLPEAMEYFKISKNPTTPDIQPDQINGEQKMNLYLTACYAIGVLISVSFNAILHLITSESVVHCSHDGGEDPHQNYGHSHSHTAEENPDVNDDNTFSHRNSTSSESYDAIHQKVSGKNANSNDSSDRAEDATEQTPLLGSAESINRVPRSKKSIIDILTHTTGDEEHPLGECRGYSSPEVCLLGSCKGKLHFCEIPLLQGSNLIHNDSIISDEHNPHHHTCVCHISRADSKPLTDGYDVVLPAPEQEFIIHPYHSHNSDHVHHNHGHNHNHLESGSMEAHENSHHHHTTSPFSKLFSIGIQTVFAITLHKLPEGFVTYITSKTNPELGIVIFLSLAFHNFTEGFAMSMPLYYAFEANSSRFTAKVKAATISGVLGALSQPLGAFIGLLFLRANSSIDFSKLNLVFGTTLAITSGFLTVIALSMYGAAVSFGGNLAFTMTWALVGIITIGISSAFGAD